MKGSTGIILALCLSSGLALRLWEDGKEYLFREESGVQVTTRDLVSAGSGLRLMSDVRVQVRGDKLIVSIENVKEAHYQQTFPEGMWPYRLVKDLEQNRQRQEIDQIQRSKYIDSVGYENGNTFIVTLENGLVKSIELPQRLSINGKNMMRALASVLQMDVTGRDMDLWTRLENSIHGECEMEYAILKGERRDIREITKSMSQLRDCKKRNIRVFDNSDARMCNGVKYDYYNDNFYNEKKTEEEMRFREVRDMKEEMYKPEPIHATSMTTFLMRGLDSNTLNVERIFSTGSVVVQRFDVEGPTYVTIANRSLILLDKKNLGAEKTVENPIVFTNLDFEWQEDELRWDEQVSVDELKKRVHLLANGWKFDEKQEDLVEEVKRKIKEHVEEMYRYIEPTHHREEAIKSLHENSLKKIIVLLANLDFENLNKLRQFYLAQRTDDEMKIAQKNVFVEALPVTGTAPAALLIRDIVFNNDLQTDFENARILASLPFHMRPIKTLVDEFYKFLQQRNTKTHLNKELTRTALDLAYAHLVRRTCVEMKTMDICFKALNIEEFIRRFDQLSEEDTKEQKVLINVLRNFGESEILEKKLLAVIRNTDTKKYKFDVRTQAVYALGNRVLKRDLEKELLLPILLRRDEGFELRIAAFDVLVKGKLTTTTINKIITHMIYEPDNEVFNYVYTTFEKLEKSLNEPCDMENREYAKYFLKFWRQNRWQKPKYSFGLSKMYSNFFMNEQYNYGGSIDVRMLGDHKTMTPLSIKMDVRSQRYKHMSMRDLGVYIRMEGIAPRIVEKITKMTRLGEMKIEELKQILLQDMSIRQRDNIPAKLDIALLMRNQVVLCYHLEDREVMTTLEMLKDYIMGFNSFENVFRLNKHFGIVFDKLRFEMPSDFGVPMAYKKDAMTVVGLNGELKKKTGIKGELKLKMFWHTYNMEKLFTLHPDNKIMFGLLQDRVFKHQLSTGVLGKIDILSKRLELSLIVPEHETPLSFLGHSQTYLLTTENKIVTRQEQLNRSCPTCELKLIISKGKDHRRNVELLDNYRKYMELYGLQGDVKLFDCELPEVHSKGQIFSNLLLSFNPLNKEPRNLFNVFLSGFRQLRAYLFYFPRVESCGINLLLHRSTSEPVKEIKIIVNLKKWDVLERPRQVGRERTFGITTDLILRGNVDRVHKIDIEYKVDPTWFESRLEIEIRRQPFTVGGKTFEEWPLALSMITKPVTKRIDRSLLMKDLTTVEKYRMRSDTKIMFGKPETRIIIEGDHMTTIEGIENLRNTWYYKKCLKEKDMLEWKHVDTLPMTDACLYAIQDLMTLHKHIWDIQATKLEPWMVNMYRKLGALLKTTLFSYWQLDSEFTSHQITPSEPKIRIEQIFHPKTNMFDLTLRYDKDVSKFIGVPLHKLGLTSLIGMPIEKLGLMNLNVAREPYSWLQNFFRLPLPFFHTSYITPETLTYLYYNQIINSCTLTKTNVRTFDNVTYPYVKEDSCWTLVAADCVENPTFAVFMKKEERTKQLVLKVMVGDTKVEFIPINENEFQLFLKGNVGKLGPIELKNNDFLYVNDRKLNEPNKLDTDYIFRILRNDRKFVLDFYPQIILNFDGNSVNVLSGPLLRGRNCGMCGDYNRVTANELKDTEMCVLKNGEEMTRAWTLKNECNSQIDNKPSCDMPFPDRILY